MSDLLGPHGSTDSKLIVRRPPRVLIIDDDQGTRETFNAFLTWNGFSVSTASSGTEGLHMARRGAFDLIVADQCLGDVDGIDVMRALRDQQSYIPFVLMSAFLTVRTSVEAMKLGAFEVIEKPIDTDTLITVVRAALHDEATKTPLSFLRDADEPQSAAVRWARYALSAVAARNDVKTLGYWARQAAVSYSTLCESCRLIDVRPHNARDFVRVLRALRLASERRCSTHVLFDVSDRRTLRTLESRAGIHLHIPPSETLIREFFGVQRFIQSDNEALSALLTMLAVPNRRLKDRP